jgi:hypothetical protein
MQHSTILILIIVLAGILGGLTNYFLSFNDASSKRESWVNLCKSLLLSLCASVTVPLFLQIIANNLLEIPEKIPYPEKNYFILLGFCVLAAFYSKRFLEDLYTKMNKIEKKANEAKQTAQRLEESKKEVDNIEDLIPTNKGDEALLTTNNQEADIRMVISAILNSSYSFRTVVGISKETKLSAEIVKSILDFLSNAGKTEKRTNKEGREVWRLIM